MRKHSKVQKQNYTQDLPNIAQYDSIFLILKVFHDLAVRQKAMKTVYGWMASTSIIWTTRTIIIFVADLYIDVVGPQELAGSIPTGLVTAALNVYVFSGRYTKNGAQACQSSCGSGRFLVLPMAL